MKNEIYDVATIFTFSMSFFGHPQSRLTKAKEPKSIFSNTFSTKSNFVSVYYMGLKIYSISR